MFRTRFRRNSLELTPAFEMAENISTPPPFPSVISTLSTIHHPRRKLSGFCGEYQNSTRIDEDLGVLGNECFLNGLSFVPNIVFVLIAVPVLISWNKSIFASMHVKTWVRFPHHTFRWILFFVLVLLNALEVVSGFLSDELLNGTHLHLYIPHLASVAGTLVAIVYYHSVEMWNSPRFLLLLIPYWLALIVIEIMKTINLNLMNIKLIYMRPHFTRASIILYILLLLVELDILRQLRYAFFKKRRMLKPPESLAETDYVQSAVSLPSKATYFWMRSLINQAGKNPLELKDLGQLPESERSSFNYSRLVAAIEEERDKQMTDEQVAATLWKCYWVKCQSMMVLAGLFMLAGSFFHLSNPILLIYILEFVEMKARVVSVNVTLPKAVFVNLAKRDNHGLDIRMASEPDAYKIKDGDMVEVKEFFSNGYVLALFLFISSILMNTFFQAGNYLVIREGVRLRGAMQLLMYTKILALSMWNFSTHAVSMSQIISHLSVDANNMLFCSCIIHFVWLLPLKMILAIGMLYGIIGWSALIGGVAVIILALLQYLMATQLSAVQKDISECADLRLKRCTELLQNIKPLKLYAWEQVVSRRVEEIRIRQLKVMLKAAALKALTTFISEGGPVIVLILAFTLYPYLEAQPLTARKVFPAILLFDIIGMPIQLLPLLSNFMVNARTSTRKVAEFLGTAEIDSKRYHMQKPKFQKTTFHIADSSQSSQSATIDDGRCGTVAPGRKGLSSDQPHSSQVKPNKAFPYQTSATGSMELLPQLSVIHEDRNEVGAHDTDSTKDDRKCRRKGSKSKTKRKALKDTQSQAGSEDVDSIGADELQRDPNPDEEAAQEQNPTEAEALRSIRNSFARSPFSSTREAPIVRRSSEGDGMSVSGAGTPLCPPVLLVPPSSGDERDARHCMRASSRRSSQQDLVSGTRRTTSVISASNSVGSGLDDDDLIDPNRDVGIAVDIHGGCFAWELEPAEPLLSDINFRADAGRLTVIVGPFGSGKSSLIAAMLGEMTRLGGNVTWKPGLTVCYAGSVPWILNASVQENILFGRPMERKRYKRVLRACALQPDIDILPEKDLTEIGDKGISLSIGQRLRISIARAIYSKADLVVLDDPFTAIDLPIGSHIFEDGILHFCLVKRKRTVILVTHELHFLPFAHAIYRMEDGCLTYHGRLQDVKECNPELFAVWQDAVRQARRENQSRAEREDTTNTERLVLLRKIRTLEFRREVAQSVLDEEKKGDSPKRVFISGQTTHITIEEEHPGGEDVPTEVAADEDEDFDPGVNCSPAKHEMNSLMLKKKKKHLLSGDSGHSVSKYEGEKNRVVVMWSAMFVYARACCLPMAFLLLVFHLLRTSALVAADFWLADWCEAEGETLQTAAYDNQNNTTSSPMPRDSDVYYVRIYALLTLASLLLCMIISFVTELLGLRAAKLFYFRMLRNLILAPMRFFDTNPIARIMSRFSGDVTIIDDKLATTTGHFVRTVLLFVGTLTVNAIITPYFLAPTAVILVIFLWFQKHFRASYRELHKLDSITKAPLLSHCVETLAGLRTIRAFREESRYWEEMERHININNSTHLWLNTANRWMGIRVDYLASLIVLSSAMACISVAVFGDVTSSLVGLGITYALLISGYMNWAVRSMADVEVQVMAVQRAYEYSSIAGENLGKTVGEADVGRDWPSAGEIVFHNVSITYSGNTQPVARSINVHIRPGEKIGICGRPGSGKSSLILSLFGMVEITEGEIYIDGAIINNMPARLLRSRIAVLPQDCTLLSGTVRYNLDPEGIHSEDSLWEALEQVNLKDTVKYLSGQLDATVTENGDNFSVCDKQLLCLARAVLKKSKVVIIDEVMSILNANTEKILRNVLRTAFSDRTVINLSHRAASLMDYDTVIVLDNGLIAEHDTPQNLLATEGSIFAALLKQRKIV